MSPLQQFWLHTSLHISRMENTLSHNPQWYLQILTQVEQSNMTINGKGMRMCWRTSWNQNGSEPSDFIVPKYNYFLKWDSVLCYGGELREPEFWSGLCRTFPLEWHPCKQWCFIVPVGGSVGLDMAEASSPVTNRKFRQAVCLTRLSFPICKMKSENGPCRVTMRVEWMVLFLEQNICMWNSHLPQPSRNVL